jgi:hypothetical protein
MSARLLINIKLIARRAYTPSPIRSQCTTHNATIEANVWLLEKLTRAIQNILVPSTCQSFFF